MTPLLLPLLENSAKFLDVTLGISLRKRALRFERESHCAQLSAKKLKNFSGIPYHHFVQHHSAKREGAN